MAQGQCEPDSSAAIHSHALACATTACGGDVGAIASGLDAGMSVCDCVASAASEALQLAPGTEKPHDDAHQHVDNSQDLALAPTNCTSLAEKVMPTCAQQCYLSVATDVGCDLLDLACQCREDTQAKLTTAMMPCVLGGCSFGELSNVMAGGSAGLSPLVLVLGLCC